MQENEGIQAKVIGGSASSGRFVDVCIQKNISLDGKPLTPTSLSSGFSETVSLREQLKDAEERAEQLQRQVCWRLDWGKYTRLYRLGKIHWGG